MLPVTFQLTQQIHISNAVNLAKENFDWLTKIEVERVGQWFKKGVVIEDWQLYC